MSRSTYPLTLGAILVLTFSVVVASAQGPQVLTNGGCVAGDSYDPMCDVNHDGDTNVVDLELVASHWGQEGTWTSEGSITWRDIVDTRRVVVATDGAGDYTTIGEALDNMDCYTGVYRDPRTCAILVMPGTYVENIKIEFKEWVHIMGSGAGITIIRPESILFPTIDLKFANHIIISGLTIKEGSTGVRINSSFDVTIMHSDIQDNRNRGIYTIGFDPRIMHNRIERNGEVGDPFDAGIYVDGGAPVITDNELRENSVGIWAKGGSSPRVRDNGLFNNMTALLWEFSTGDIVDNEISGGGRAGILLLDGSNPKIRQNRVGGNTIGIEVGDSSSPDISENRIAGNGEGILFYNSTGSARVVRNTIEGNSRDAIRVQSGSVVLAIIGNTIWDNEGNGIFLDGYSNTTSPLSGGGAIISHNAAYGNGSSSGVDVRVSNCVNGSHVTITHNIVNTYSGSIVCVEGGLNARVNGAILPQF